MHPTLATDRILIRGRWVMKPRTPSDYEFISYQPQLRPLIIELQKNLWSSSTALNASYFDWKYGRNPYVKEPLIYLAMRNGKPVGMRGFFGVRWEGGSPARQTVCLYADDMVVAPEHRGNGLMSQIMNAAFRDLSGRNFSHAFNLSAGAVTLRSSLSMGWRSAGWAHPIRRRSWTASLQRGLSIVEHRGPSLQGRLRSLVAGARQSLRGLGANRMHRHLRNNSAIRLEHAPRCAEMAELVARMRTNGKIRHVRDSEYFHWRFQNPLSRYWFLFWVEERLEGYLVLQEYTSDLADRVRLNIVDWEGTTPAAQSGLLEAASIFANDRPLWIWASTLPQLAIDMLKQRGFRTPGMPPDPPLPPSILVRPLCHDPSDGEWRLVGQTMLDLANWDLRMLYSMHG
jgi:GNAT superfamily N-acetyltransferase